MKTILNTSQVFVKCVNGFNRSPLNKIRLPAPINYKFIINNLKCLDFRTRGGLQRSWLTEVND